MDFERLDDLMHITKRHYQWDIEYAMWKGAALGVLFTVLFIIGGVYLLGSPF